MKIAHLQHSCQVDMVIQCFTKKHLIPKSKVTLQQMVSRSHTLIYVRGTLGIRRVRSKYADIHVPRCTLFYMQRENTFWTYLQLFTVYERIIFTLANANHTQDILCIRLPNAFYVKETLKVRYLYVI